MIRCKQFINIIERDNIADHVTTLGNHVINGLRDIARSTDAFTSVRGCGSLIAFTLPTPEARGHMLNSLMNNGVIALPCGTRSVRFRLPLIMTIEEADTLLERTGEAVHSQAATA